jgi:2,3-bisphosphoglycerate-dependent phosphoglycerate mutase
MELIAVRHGQSTANVAFPRADAAGSEQTGLSGPDSAVELTALGQEQSTALGKWLSTRDLDAIVSSPYLRARETTRIALAEFPAEHRPPVRLDERLRDREMGILEMLSRAAINRRFPDEQRRRSWAGDFSYRAPGGESMADVLLRVRSFLADADLRYPGQRVLVVAHDATIAMLRFAVEDLSEEDSYPLAPIGNATVTRWVRTGDRMELAEFNSAVA